MLQQLSAVGNNAVACMFEQWSLVSKLGKRKDLFDGAIKGIHTALFGGDLFTIFSRCHVDRASKCTEKANFDPPIPLERGRGASLEFAAPSDLFVQAANNAVEVMHICMVACCGRRASPPRWTWEQHLLTVTT